MKGKGKIKAQLSKSVVSNIVKYKSDKSKEKLTKNLKNKDLNEILLKEYKNQSIKKKKNLNKTEENEELKLESSSINEKEEKKQRSKSVVVKPKEIKEKIISNSDELKPKEIIFTHPDKKNLINYFRPNLTPRQIFLLGSFGGTYWRPIYSGVLKKNIENHHLKFKNIYDPFTKKQENWWEGISDNLLTRKIPDINLNKYKAHSGTTLEAWESSGWIKSQDPYGWVQWYCEFYSGRRSEDDNRQIQRWLNFAGPKGRFKLRIIGMIKNKNTSFDDENVSPVIRQGLQHWGYQLTPEDIN